MKKLFMKLSETELLSDLIMGGFIIIMGGGILFYILSQLVSYENLQLLEITAIMTFFIIFLSWIAFYISAKLRIKWYKEILDYIPMPIIMTDKNANWKQINKAASKTFSLEKGENINKLNSRHLINEGGKIENKIWTQNGEKYIVAGNRLYIDDKDKIEGYLFLFYSLNELKNIYKLKAGTYNDITEILNQVVVSTEHFRNCTSSLTERIKRQSYIINRLTCAVEMLVSGSVDNSFNETMEDILNELRVNLEYEEVNSEAIRNFISEISKIDESIDNYISDG